MLCLRLWQLIKFVGNAAMEDGFVSLQAVILAIDEGSRSMLYPFAEERPLPCQPLVNRPLLYFQLKMMHTAGLRGESYVVFN